MIVEYFEFKWDQVSQTRKLHLRRREQLFEPETDFMESQHMTHHKLISVTAIKLI